MRSLARACRIAAAVLLLALVGDARDVHAHGALPQLVRVVERGPGDVRVTVGARGEAVAVDVEPGLAAVVVRGLEGDGEAVVEVTRADGRTLTALATAASPRVEVGATPSAGLGYLRLGVMHILGGYDHVLFLVVLVLLLARQRARALAGAVSAFTAGHAVSLSLAALGVVHVPSAPVECLIALSIMALAAEVLRAEERPRAAMMCALFGLLHGLGFAGALASIGLPEGEVPLALLAFNAGVELGQLALVLAAALVVARLPRAAARGLAYAAGGIACFWMIERIGGLGT